MLSYIYNKNYTQLSYDVKETIKAYSSKDTKINQIPIKKLKIPSIKLTENIYADEKNTVDYGLELMYEDEKHILIVGHSGTGPLAKFKNLVNVNIDDKAYITEEKSIKGYILKEVSKLKKDNTFRMKLSDESKLYLITCSPYDKNYNLIFEFSAL